MGFASRQRDGAAWVRCYTPRVSSSNDTTAAYWNERHADPGAKHENFLDHPMVAAYISLRAFGNITAHLDVVVAELRTKTPAGARVFSPGCGAGAKERALARALPDRHIVACDIASQALTMAQEEAAREGLTNVEFIQQDFNDLHLDAGSFDAVAGMGAFHHIEKLEGFWKECRRALRPGGVIMGQEYIGPPRFQWTDAQVEEGSRVLAQMVPGAHRPHHDVVRRPAVEEVIALDPSEAVRSHELLSTLADTGFELFGYASGGSALLQPVLMYQVHTYHPQRWDHNLVLAQIFAEEDRLMRDGRLGDDFCMFVTKPL